MLANYEKTSIYKRILCAMLVIVFTLQPFIWSASASPDIDTPENTGNTTDPIVGDSGEEGQEPSVPPPLDAESVENGTSKGVLGDSSRFMLTALAVEDITVKLDSSLTRYPAYTNVSGNIAPPRLAISVNVSVAKTDNLDDNRIRINITEHTGMFGTAFFENPTVEAMLDGDPIFEDIQIFQENGEQYVEVQLKKNIINGTSFFHIHLDFCNEYDGKAYNNTELLEAHYEIYSNDILLKTSKPLVITAEAELGQRFNNLGNSSPKLVAVEKDSPDYKADVVPGTLIQLNDQRILNNFYYKNHFDPEEPPVYRLILPVGSSLESEGFKGGGKVLHKGVNNEGVPVADGEYENVPAGKYYIFEVPIHATIPSPNAKETPWAINIGGVHYRCEVSYSLAFHLPEAPIGETQNVYMNFEYTKYGGPVKENFTTSLFYKNIKEAEWDLARGTAHSPGVSGDGQIPVSGIGSNVTSELNRLLSAIRAAGYGYTHGSSQKNQGFGPIENVKFVLQQKGASHAYAKANFIGMYGDPTKGLELRVGRESDDFPWNKYQYYFLVQNVLTGETRKSAGKKWWLGTTVYCTCCRWA